MEFTIRDADKEDTPSISDIYNHYIRESIVTFEETPVTPSDMQIRMEEITSGGFPWLVAEHDGKILGYAYAGKWNKRSAYRFMMELTVYLHPDASGHGVGTALYTHLIGICKELGCHVLIGGISLPNPASVALHEKMGMKKVAHYEEVGFKFGRWIDVGYWQMKL